MVIQSWECPVYAQRYPQAGFAPDLSVLDLLFNEGPRSLQILQSRSGISQACPVTH
ncbi:MAG: WbqC family protein [Candidatus Xenobia bacterium]